MDLLSGLIGAIIGGLIASLTTLWVFRLERRRQNQISASDLRRELTVSLVRSFEHFRDCQANPQANAYRVREVTSSFETDSALFRANIETASSVAEYVELVKQQVRLGTLQWLDPDIFATHLAEPLLRWSVADPAWSDAAIGLLLDLLKKHKFLPTSVPTDEERRAAG